MMCAKCYAMADFKFMWEQLNCVREFCLTDVGLLDSYANDNAELLTTRLLGFALHNDLDVQLHANSCLHLRNCASTAAQGVDAGASSAIDDVELITKAMKEFGLMNGALTGLTSQLEKCDTVALTDIRARLSNVEGAVNRCETALVALVRLVQALSPSR